MPDIAQHLPQQSKTVEAIYTKYKELGDAHPVRGYLGASIIGHHCERYLWYCFRQCCSPDISGRIYRLFATGDLEELRFEGDLINIGCEVHITDKDGEQYEVSALGGHFSGHMDGCALGIPEAPKTWHVLEFKTHNAKSFRELVKKGVKESKPQHYAQMMVYMHLTGMKRALYLAANKDTDELYSERIKYWKAEAEALMERAERVITSTSPPDRCAGRPDWYQCTWCDAKQICWGTNHEKDGLGVVPDGPALPIPSLSCRQCCHATPIIDREDAQWICKDNRTSIACPEIGCKDHLILPGLIAFAEPTDYGTTDEGNNFIEFTSEDGTKWGHGNTADCYGSEELRTLPANLLTNKFLHGAKELFGATFTHHEIDILQRYPKEDSRMVWEGLGSRLIAVWKEMYGEDLLSLTPIARNTGRDYNVIELEGGRVAIVYHDTQTAEIRQGIE